MKPSIGRIVHYEFPEGESSDQGQSRTVPAIIVHVFSDDCVNLRIFQDGVANPLWETSVMHVDASGNEGEGRWSWPPRVD